MHETSGTGLGGEIDNEEAGELVGMLKEFALRVATAPTHEDVSAAAWGLLEALEQMAP